MSWCGECGAEGLHADGCSAPLEEAQNELARLREENKRLERLTDYLRAGEVNIDEQERMWREAQNELARLREALDGNVKARDEALQEVARLRVEISDLNVKVSAANLERDNWRNVAGSIVP